MKYRCEDRLPRMLKCPRNILVLKSSRERGKKEKESFIHPRKNTKANLVLTEMS